MRNRDGPNPEVDGDEVELVETRLRRIFIGSVSLSFFIVLLLTFLMPVWAGLPQVARYVYPIILGWSLLVSGYVFHAQWSLSEHIKQKLRRQSYVDEVTQVFNYRYLDLRLSEEAERTRRHGGLTAVLYIDLDGFKEVNDRFGHQIGNVVLEEVAANMARQVRSCDVFGRVGGDEFLAILPQTDRREAYVLGERLRESIENYSLEMQEGQVVDFVRTSIGVAAFPVNGETMDNVITAADNAVYESKEKGGNSVTMAGEFVTSEEGGRPSLDRIPSQERGAER